MPTWTVQPHTGGRVIWKKMHQMEEKLMYNSETPKKRNKPWRQWHLIRPLFIIRPCSLRLRCHIGDVCHDTRSGWCWRFRQLHPNPAWRMSQAQGICIQTTLTHLNIHPEQWRLVRTVRVCYSNGTECTWHCVFIRKQPLSEGALIFSEFLTCHPFIFARSCSFSTCHDKGFPSDRNTSDLICAPCYSAFRTKCYWARVWFHCNPKLLLTHACVQKAHNYP